MTGLRQGELIALRWVDVDWKAGRIRVRRNCTRQEFGAPKSKRSSRSVPMTKRVVAELKAHFERTEYSGDDDLVFCHPEIGHPLDASKTRRRYKKALKKAGVRAVRFHDLRHTFGTRCAAEGVPMRMLQEWMGHRDIKTTQIYADYAPSPHEADLLERAFASSEDDEESDPPAQPDPTIPTPTILSPTRPSRPPLERCSDGDDQVALRRPSGRRVGRLILKAVDEVALQRLRKFPHRRQAATMLAALQARDHGVARAHPLCQLLLGESERHPLVDHQPGEFLEGTLLFERSSIRGALASALLHCLRVGSSHRRLIPTSHLHPISIDYLALQLTKSAKSLGRN